MKKALFIFSILICIKSNAQFVDLHDFDYATGEQPFGSVVLSSNDSVLYGSTNSGGSLPSSAGVVYSMNTDGTGYAVLHNFTSDAVSGAWSYGSLIRSGNVLYGMTSGHGLYGDGTIFKINTDGTGYTKLHDFNSVYDSISGQSGGGSPNGTLTIVGNKLYGMTYGTNGPDVGNIFSIKTDGTGYTDLFYFNGINGSHPGYGALAISGNRMFGTTMYGGVNGKGVLFSVDTNGTGYIKLLDFNYANGEMPYGTVLLAGNVLYGNTGGGGLYGKGVVYSIHTDGTGYTKLLDFDGINGQNPNGDLILSGNILYGTTGGGGTNNMGTIFSMDTLGINFQTMFSFAIPTGSNPRPAMTCSNINLYGTAVNGGVFGHGTIFSYPLLTSVIGIDENNSGMSFATYPNPSNGNLMVDVELLKNAHAQLNVMNSLGQKIVIQEHDLVTGKNKLALDLSNLAKGVYFIQIKTATDIITKRIVLN